MSSSPPLLPRPHVVVRGEAVLLVDPEVADISITVRTRARDRQSALERCAARQAEVAAVLASAEDAVEKLETAGVSVHLEVRDRRAPGEPVASVHTQVTVNRLELAGELVVALGRLDDVAVSGPTWRLRADSGAFERARLDAVSDAVHRARQYAAAFGAELVELVEVADTGLGSSVRVAGAVPLMAAFDSGAPALDLAPAPQEVHGSVEVRFTTSAPDPEVFRR